MSMKSDIAAAIEARIAAVAGINYTSFDRIRLDISDFKDYEYPAVQIYDVAQISTHEMGRIKANWSIAVELIMKTTQRGFVSQTDLWDLQYEVERALWARPVNLGVSGVIDMVYTGSETDLHSLGDDVYFARLDLEVQFYQPLVGDC